MHSQVTCDPAQATASSLWLLWCLRCFPAWAVPTPSYCLGCPYPILLLGLSLPHLTAGLSHSTVLLTAFRQHGLSLLLLPPCLFASNCIGYWWSQVSQRISAPQYCKCNSSISSMQYSVIYQYNYSIVNYIINLQKLTMKVLFLPGDKIIGPIVTRSCACIGQSDACF